MITLYNKQASANHTTFSSKEVVLSAPLLGKNVFETIHSNLMDIALVVKECTEIKNIAIWGELFMTFMRLKLKPSNSSVFIVMHMQEDFFRLVCQEGFVKFFKCTNKTRNTRYVIIHMHLL